MTPCSVVNRPTYELPTLKTEPAVSSEVLAREFQTRPHHFPECSESAVAVDTVQYTFLIESWNVRF